jgi:alkylation response protein AidB-like acyl-CoA dehydrogenase
MKTVKSGILQQCIWSGSGLRELCLNIPAARANVEQVIADSIAALNQMKVAGTAYDGNGKITDHSLQTLGKTGWFGIALPVEYGGSGASIHELMLGITKIAAAGFATEAGLNGIHTDLGAPDKLMYHGNDWQKSQFLPALASGERLSALAATEPCAGTNLAALETTAHRDGDHYVINGSKIFIGNAWPTELIGRTIALLARVPEEGPDSYAIFIVEVLAKDISVIPHGTEIPADVEGYIVVPHGSDGGHGFHAIRQARNTGLVFRNLRVPACNRIEGNGLKHTYEGLNPGRIAVLANAAGAMRLILRLIAPNAWGKYRESFGKPIEDRELIKTRIARLAALIVGADALRNFCASQLDNGDRFGLSCIIAKIFGSEAISEAAIDLGLMTAGGRGFLHGHPIGDNLADFLAGRIYDGQNDMLRQKFLAELMAPHVELLKQMAEDMKALAKGKLAGLRIVKSATAYLGWKLKQSLRSLKLTPSVKLKDSCLQEHLSFAEKLLPKLSKEISAAMTKHGAKLADRQNVLIRLSQRVQDALIIAITAGHADASGSEATIAAADILCRDLRRRLTGSMADECYDRACVRLAELIKEGKFSELEGAAETPIFRAYEKK